MNFRLFRPVVWSGVAAFSLIFATSAGAQLVGSRMMREFVNATAQSDQFEILEAKIALTTSRDAEIRAFATRMIEDHTRSSGALMQAATRLGLAPPEKGVSDDQARFLGSLQSLTGIDFDKAYARQQILAHRSVLATEQMYAASGDDPTLRSLAASNASIIESHLAMLEPLVATRAE